MASGLNNQGLRQRTKGPWRLTNNDHNPQEELKAAQPQRTISQWADRDRQTSHSPQHPSTQTSIPTQRGPTNSYNTQRNQRTQPYIDLKEATFAVKKTED